MSVLCCNESGDHIKALAASSPYAGCAADAPALIVSAYRKDDRFPAYAPIDLSIANENLWLEADSLELGGVWLGIAPLEDRFDESRIHLVP